MAGEFLKRIMPRVEPMIDVTIKMSVPSDKRLEVLQTIKSLLDPIRNEPGCLSCCCSVDAEAENIIIFRQAWKSNEDLDAHLKSDHFSILLGAMKLLCIEPEVRFNTIASTAGEEAITAVRTPMKTRLDDRRRTKKP
jgi:quinol monooxygenase YgiN